MSEARRDVRRELARDAVARLCASGLSTRDLFEQVAARVRPVVPYVAAGWLSTDPATLLYTDAVVENVAGGLHLELFENELITPDSASPGGARATARSTGRTASAASSGPPS